MEQFLTTLVVEFTPQVLFGLIGGAIGGVAAADKKNYGIKITLIAIIMSAATGGATADYLSDNHYTTSLFAIMVFTCIVGIPTGAFMDVLVIFSPRFAERVVNLVENKTIDKLDNIL